MKKFLFLPVMIAMAATAWGAGGSQDNPLPLNPGTVTVDFTDGSQVFYTYTPTTDCMMVFSDLTNVYIYAASVTPDDQRYGDSFNGVTYVQTHADVKYTISVSKGWTSDEPSFTFDTYESPWPGGESWATALIATDRMGYLPITLNLPTYLKYTPAEDGVLSMFFTAFPTVKYATSTDGPFTNLTTSYQNGGGYKGSLDVTGGQTYYFTVEGHGSMMYRFELLHPVTGSSPDFPYTVNEGTPALFPKEAGTYYYKIVNNGSDNFMLIEGSETFRGTAKAGTSFAYFEEESTDRIHIRMSVSSSYKEYYMVLTRDAAATADQHFNVTYSNEPYDIFPGRAIEAGDYTTPDFGGLYYYTFTVPEDGRNIISLSTTGENLDESTKATLYYASNQYSALASGQNIEYEAAAGREYTVTWRVAPADAPLRFSLAFNAPAAGESPGNPIIATLGENSAESAKQLYFKYTATLDGWMFVKPAAGLPMPSVSMLPIPSDPYTQACEVIADGDSYRVAVTKDRGYLITFNKTGVISFDISEKHALEGESPSNPFVVDGDTAVIPDATGTFWFSYTARRDGKLDISTDLPFEISENRQDYTFVRIYNPADPDNFIAELRPDYDNHTFATRVLDTTEGTRYLVKVRTMQAAEGHTVTIVVRDPIDGEIPELPIMIPFNGQSGTYAFDRMINYATDALWYGINLPVGKFSFAGPSIGSFEMTMYAPGDLTTPVAEATQLGVDYDDEQQMYIYIWGIEPLDIATPGTFLMHVTYNSVPFAVDLKMATDAIDTITPDDARAADVWHNLQGLRLKGQPSAPGIYIHNGRKIVVK